MAFLMSGRSRSAGWNRLACAPRGAVAATSPISRKRVIRMPQRIADLLLAPTLRVCAGGRVFDDVVDHLLVKFRAAWPPAVRRHRLENYLAREGRILRTLLEEFVQHA